MADLKKTTRKDHKGRNLKDGESQRADLRYQYRYTDNAGKRCTIYDWDLADLRIKEKQIQKDMDDNINTGGSKITFNQQFQKYIDTKPRLALSTKNNYLDLWKNHIEKESLGNKKICDIVKSDLLLFYNGLVKKGFKNGTIQLFQNIMYPCFQLAVDDNIIRTNPAKDCMKEFSKNDAKKKEALTIDEQSRLINFVANSQYYSIYLPMITFMLSTACRCGETIGITWDDIDMKKKLISIDHQLIYKKVDGCIKFYVSTPKTETGQRTIPMTNELFEQLKKQREYQLILGVDHSYQVDGYKNFVFTTKGGKPMQPNCVNRFLANIVKTYNDEEKEKAKKEHRKPIELPSISAHTLRHTGCTRMAESGMDIKALQYIMGHATLSMTMDIYNHIDTTRVISEMQKVDGIFKIS
jgi:integrase